MQRDPRLRGRFGVRRGHGRVREPPEDVPDPALAGFVAPAAGHDAAVDDAAHARHLDQRVVAHHVAGRGAHDGDHLAGLGRSRGGRGDVGIDVADGDRDAHGQAGHAAASLGEPARHVAELADLAGELLLGEAREPRVQRRQEVAGRVAAVLVDPLVAGGARVAHVATGELPDDPVRCLDEVVRAGVELRVLLQQLEALGELPLAGDQASVAADPGLPPRVRELVDPVRLRLGRVVLPELHVGVRPVDVPRQLAQRRPVRQHRQHRAGGEVGPEADHLAGSIPATRTASGTACAQHVDVVARHLQRPVRRQRPPRRRRGACPGPRARTRARRCPPRRRRTPGRRRRDRTGCRSRCRPCTGRSAPRGHLPESSARLRAAVWSGCYR